MHPIDFVRAFCAAHPNFVFGILIAWVVSTIASLAVRTLHSPRFTAFENAHPILGGSAHAIFGVLGNGDQVRRGVLLILGAFGIVPPTTPLGGGGAGSGDASPAASSTSAYRVAVVMPAERRPRPAGAHVGLQRALLPRALGPKLVSGLVAATMLLGGCSWWNRQGPAVVTNVGGLVECVLSHVGEDPKAVAVACGVEEVGTVVSIFSAHEKAMARARASASAAPVGSAR